MQKVREVFLLVAVLGAHLVGVGAEILQHVGVCTQREAVDGRVAHDALAQTPKARVVVDDAELTGQLEKLVHAADNHHVQIKEQRLALQAVQVALEGGELLPGAIALAGRQVDVQIRNRKALDLAAQALCVVGQADKAEIATQVAAHHRIEPVDILGAILGTPLHAKNVAIRHTISPGVF